MTHYILDCDDVLLDWQGGFLNFVRKRGLDPDPAGPNSWCMSNWLGVSESYARVLIDEFNRSPAFGQLAPAKNAIETVYEITRRGHTCSVLTCCGETRKVIQARTNNLHTVFGNVFTSIDILPLGVSKFGRLFWLTRNRDPRNMRFIEDNFEHAKSGAINRIRSYCIRKTHNRKDEADNPTSSVIWIDDISEAL